MLSVELTETLCYHDHTFGQLPQREKNSTIDIGHIIRQLMQYPIIYHSLTPLEPQLNSLEQSQ
jgi:hypothetical protein